MSHTEGKLTANGTEIYREDGTQVCFIEPVFPFEECSDDARRLVACWNVCAHMSTDSLEQIAAWIADSQIPAAKLARERDELMEALRKADVALSAFCNGEDWLGTMPGDTLKEVRAILAKYPEARS